jgi:hypothetical protein
MTVIVDIDRIMEVIVEEMMKEKDLVCALEAEVQKVIKIVVVVIDIMVVEEIDQETVWVEVVVEEIDTNTLSFGYKTLK